tara:strand:+ start:1959 stop:2111 length:153 start_codon:yes stop_codon:yes gene_type:complete
MGYFNFNNFETSILPKCWEKAVNSIEWRNGDDRLFGEKFKGAASIMDAIL